MRAYERLIRYTRYPTASNPDNKTCPSTTPQLEFGKILVEEMKSLGIDDAFQDEHGYVYGTISANCETSAPVIGFIAHLDVSNDAPDQNIKPRLVEAYDGGPIVLNQERNIVMSPEDFAVLKDYVGDDLVVTDGTTLLGADDKAGIAEILTMAEYFQNHPEVKHGTIKIGFTPDEEIGRGADLFDVEGFGAEFAYTVDGGAYDAAEFETFNAASAVVTITGVSIHPGTAKNKLLNASLVAMEFQSMLPAAQRPEHTEGYEGFFHLLGMEGRVEEAKLTYIIRDHDREKLAERKKVLEEITAYLNGKYGKTVELHIEDSYLNMAEEVRKHWHLIENAYAAIEEAGGKPHSLAIRGGTDGSRLSFMGLPCPNLGTGSHNAHGRMEFASAQAMDKCVQVLVGIAQRYLDFQQ